ncbi:hypothetical protein CW749_28035 [Vibrio sp. vnigr-6D03]|uniref:tetratricopeptide repeat protein n=1 Tax=Vibrio sp. vnigr-6D03 TaxID=2058088 RepID=UPI000C34CE2A|nr:tetratricopeptide repeat protein [Vibrio sp. vnigr-6D03]PKF76251.1 hypothetical protein CW749_28035 [Vibrio sp. vnigr-6D03]
MDLIWKALGHDSVIQKVSNILGNDKASRILVEGPPGSGKSWLCKGVGTRWEEEGGVCVVIEGDRDMVERPYYPLCAKPQPLAKTWKYYQDAIIVIGRILDLGVLSGKVFSSVSDRLADHLESNIKQKLPFLDDLECSFIQSLCMLCKNKHPLLIVDNVHWLDKGTLQFLQLLIDNKLTRFSGLGILENLNIIIIRTEEKFQKPIEKQYLEESIYTKFEDKFHIKGVSREKLEDILGLFFNTKNLTDKEFSKIHESCGENLAFVYEVALFVQGGGELTSIKAKDLLDKIVIKKLNNITNTNNLALDTLKCASLLGLSFHVNELFCISNKNESDVKHDLNIAFESGIVEKERNRAKFSHDSFRNLFKNKIGIEKPILYDKLSNCLKKLSPSEYAFRSFVANQAENYTDEAIFTFLEAVRRIRLGINSSEYISGIKKTILDENELLDIYNDVKEAWELINIDQASLAIDVLDKWEPINIIQPLVKSEINYTLSNALLSTRIEADRMRAIDIIKENKLDAMEVEINVRFLILELYSNFLNEDKTIALNNIKEIEYILNRSKAIGSEIKDFLFNIYRMFNGIYTPEISVKFMEKSVLHFSKELGGEVIKPLEYFMSLNNLASVLICLGRYNEAEKHLNSGLNILKHHDGIKFRDLEYLLHNNILCRYKSKKIKPIRAFREQEKIVSNRNCGLSNILLENNLIVYALLSNKYDEAVSIAGKMASRLESINNVEIFIEYLVRQSIILVDFHCKSNSESKNNWIDLIQLVECIPYESRQFYIDRHQELITAFDNISCGDCDSWEKYMEPKLREISRGPLWDEFLKGFLLTEIQYWKLN